MRSPGRRRIARALLAILIVIHLCAFWLYNKHTEQTAALALYLDARNQWRDGQGDLAEAEYRRFLAGYEATVHPVLLLRAFPDAAGAWFGLGRIASERGEIDLALDAYRRAMAEQPGTGRREYRDLLLEHGRERELIAFASEQLKRDARAADAYWDLGAAHLALGEPAAAVQAYRGALEVLGDFLRRHHRALPAGTLSAEEGDLRGLLSIALLEAGEREPARAACAEVARRELPEQHLDALCAASLAAAAGDPARVAQLLKGYRPTAPEHARLLARLRALPGADSPLKPGPPAVDNR